ncbi:hypothetical protein [Sulfurovum sp.]|uniref:hypothetical protein n=1 Tax=Sulfurovum sp. TaxID=1969726 RepID=UPI003568E062
MKFLLIFTMLVSMLSASTTLHTPFQPQDGKNGYVGVADVTYVIKNCYGDPNLIVNIKTKNTKYRYEDKLYDLNRYSSSKTSAKGYTVLEGDIYNSNFDLGHIEYSNITNFNAAGCYSDTYSLTNHLGLGKEFSKEDTIHFLKLLNPVLYINSRDYDLEKEIKKGLSQKNGVVPTASSATVGDGNSFNNQNSYNALREQQQRERQIQQERQREQSAQEQRRLDEQRRYAQQERYTQQEIENQRQSDAIQEKMQADARREQEKREALQSEIDSYELAQRANEQQLANNLTGLATAYANSGAKIPEPVGWALVVALFGALAVVALPNDTGTNTDFEYSYIGTTMAVISVGGAFAAQFLDFDLETGHTITISKSEHSIENNEYYLLTSPNGTFSGFTVSSANYWTLNPNAPVNGMTVWVDYYYQSSDDPVYYRVDNGGNAFFLSSQVTQGASAGVGFWSGFNNGLVLSGGVMLADIRLYEQQATVSLLNSPMDLETVNSKADHGLGIPLRAELSYKYLTLTSTYNYGPGTLSFGVGLHY